MIAVVAAMKRKNLRRWLETMPRPAYIFLKHLLRGAAGMLAGSLLLFLRAGTEPQRRHLAVLFLETPAGVLLLGALGLAVLLDRFQD